MTAKAQGRTLYTCPELTCPVITFISGRDAHEHCPVCETDGEVLVDRGRSQPYRRVGEHRPPQ